MPPQPPQEPNGLLLFAICLVGALALIGLLKLNHWRVTRHAQQNNERVNTYAHGGSDITSSGRSGDSPERPVAAPVVRGATTGGQLIATTDNEDNSQLSDNDLLPEEVRDIIRFQAKVEALAMLYNMGQVTNLAKGIEQTFGCSRSSKEDSLYQRAKRALEPMIAKQPEPTPIAGRPTSARFADDPS